MRSSRSGAESRGSDPLDPGPHGFAHRGVHRAPAIPENSLTAFAAALEINAGIECDVRLTADDQLLVFHDRDATRLCDDPAVISDSTLAQLAHLRIRSGPIPTLGQLLALVGGRMPILIEAKVERDLWRFGPALVKAIDGYAGRFGVMSFDPRLARWLRTNRPGIRRGLVVSDSLHPLSRWLALRLADPDFIAVDVAALGKAWVARARARLPVYSWTIKTREQRREAMLHADALIWEADGRP